MLGVFLFLAMFIGFGAIVGGTVWAIIRTKNGAKLSKEEFVTTVLPFMIPGLVLFTLGMVYYIPTKYNEFQSTLLLTTVLFASIAYSLMTIGFIKSRMKYATSS